MFFEIDVALILSVISLAVAILSPVLVALSNHRHERKMYRMKFVTEHKHEVIEHYLRSAGKCIFMFDLAALSEFESVASEIFMYAPEEKWDDLDRFNKSVASCFNSAECGANVRAYLQALQSDYFDICRQFSKHGRR